MNTTYRDPGGEADTIEDSRIVSQGDDVQMMRSPHLWPMAGCLFLKRYDSDNRRMENGYVVEDFEHPCRVYRGRFGYTDYMFVDYDSFQAIAEDGWTVD